VWNARCEVKLYSPKLECFRQTSSTDYHTSSHVTQALIIVCFGERILKINFENVGIVLITSRNERMAYLLSFLSFIYVCRN